MALYLKRLKGQKLCVGAEQIIRSPTTLAQTMFNPILNYLEEQYTEIAQTAPRKSLVSFMNRDYDESSSMEDDVEKTWEDYTTSQEYWWNVDYLPIFEEKITRFNQIVDGIKDGTFEKTDALVNELQQVGEDCACALFDEYLKYCFFYELALIFYCGAKPQSWWLLKGRFSMSRTRASRPSPPFGGTTYYVGGHAISFDYLPEWEDKPYEFDGDWTDWLPWHIWKSKYRRKKEKLEDKWGEFVDYMEDNGWIRDEVNNGSQLFDHINNVRLKTKLNPNYHNPHYHGQ